MKLDRERTPEFDLALAKAWRDPQQPQPKCDGKAAEYMDFAGPPPSEADTKAMCEGDEERGIEPCPLLAICKRSARHQRPSHGIQGGIAWRDGKQFHWLLKLGHIDETGKRIDPEKEAA